MIRESDDPLSDKTVCFDGNKLQSRHDRFVDTLKPEFFQSTELSNLGELFSKLLTLDNDWADYVTVRLFIGK